MRDADRRLLERRTIARFAFMQPLLRAPKLGDILDDREAVKHRSGLVAHERGCDASPKPRPVLPHITLLEDVAVDLSGVEPPVPASLAGNVEGIGDVDERLFQQFLARVTQHDAKLVVDGDEPAVERRLLDADGGCSTSIR